MDSLLSCRQNLKFFYFCKKLLVIGELLGLSDAACRSIWKLLCDISRSEFQKVYEVLDVRIEEVGESFYNPLIPSVNKELQDLGLATEEEGQPSPNLT